MSNEQEPRKFELAAELLAVQNRLANLTPKALRTDRDQLMFSAGRASASRAVPGPVSISPSPNAVRSNRFWRAATATMTAATILLAAMLVHERGSQSIADATRPPTAIADLHGAATAAPFVTRTSRSRATSGYLGIRNTALDRGLSALTTEIDAATTVLPQQSKPATARDLRDELLLNPRQRS